MKPTYKITIAKVGLGIKDKSKSRFRPRVQIVDNYIMYGPDSDIVAKLVGIPDSMKSKSEIPGWVVSKTKLKKIKKLNGKNTEFFEPEIQDTYSPPDWDRHGDQQDSESEASTPAISPSE